MPFRTHAEDARSRTHALRNNPPTTTTHTFSDSALRFDAVLTET